MKNFLVALIFSTYIATELALSKALDPNGYIVYCPCMGRFGNQAEQLLGTLLFAKSINRTLVLPPFIYYDQFKPRLLKFDQVIQVDPIREYHRVIVMESFMNKISDKIWPKGQRTFFCYSARRPKVSRKCDALDGEPFNTFWKSFDVREDAAEFYSPLTTTPNLSQDWQRIYSGKDWPVLAFLGAPSPFPTYQESIKIQRYLKFSDVVAEEAKKSQQQWQFWNKPYIGIHLRHGKDWKNACDLLKSTKTRGGMTQLFSSAQCTGYGDSLTPLEYKVCLPDAKTVVETLKNVLSIGKASKNISTVYVATDKDDMDLWKYLVQHIPDMTLITPSAIFSPNSGWIYYSPAMIRPTPIVDTYLLSYADLFIGNCISSFSAFVARIRSEQLHLSAATHYVGWKLTISSHGQKHSDEL